MGLYTKFPIFSLSNPQGNFMSKSLSAFVQDLIQAYESQQVIPPFCEKNDLTLEDAYTIQALLCEHWQKNGDAPIGKKVAFANTPSQQSQGLQEPAFATMFASGLFKPNTLISLRNLPNAIIEAEVTFLLEKDLKGPNITTAQVIDATKALYASFEIVACRVTPSTCGYDKIAGNVCFGGLILSEKAYSPKDLDLPNLVISLEKNGQTVSTATGAAVLGSPANSVAWLANTLIAKGQFLKKGDLVLSGAAPTPQPILPGDVYTAHFGHLGSISATFTE